MQLIDKKADFVCLLILAETYTAVLLPSDHKQNRFWLSGVQSIQEPHRVEKQQLLQQFE